MQPRVLQANSVRADQHLQVHLAQPVTIVPKALSSNTTLLAVSVLLPQRVLLQPVPVVRAQMETSVKKAVQRHFLMALIAQMQITFALEE